MGGTIDKFTGSSARKRAGWQAAESQRDIRKQKQQEDLRLAEASDEAAKKKLQGSKFGRRSLIKSGGTQRNTELGQS